MGPKKVIRLFLGPETAEILHEKAKRKNGGSENDADRNQE